MLQSNPARSDGFRVVVADHNDNDRHMVGHLLRAEKVFFVEEASTYNGLMTLLAEGEFDCILVDGMLGTESGFGLHGQLRTMYPNPPALIMLTGAGNEQAVIKALRCGFSDYVKKKSLNVGELINAILHAVDRRRAAGLQRDELEYLARLASLDRLTGLPNRKFLEDRLSMLTENRKRHRNSFAALKIDINNFNNINGDFGYAVGDAALRAFADRLKQVSRSSDVFGRYADDEFLYIIDNDVSAGTTDQVCRRLAEALSFPVELENMGLTLSCSIGAAIYPADGETPGELLASAEVSLRTAKESGGGYHAGPAGDELVAKRRHTGLAELAASETMPDLHAVHRAENRRTERRQRVLKRGIIFLNDGFSTVNCTIRDLSPNGARITIEAEYSPPALFSLLIVETGRKVFAERRWRRGRDIGLKLLPAPE